MNKITKFFAGVSVTSVIAVAVLVSASHAKAVELPNILVGPDLKVGSSNQNVVMLQSLLSELGFLNVPVGVPFGYYGPLTRAAVANYQARMNVSPAVGYYGPLTKMAMSSNFASRGYLRILGW